MKSLWSKIKKWFTETALDWIKKGWLQLVNVIVVFLAYNYVYESGKFIEVIIGFWFFILLAYWIFWKFFGAEKLFKPKE
jgi:hypothetical protein